jgi:hypothetical protein
MGPYPLFACHDWSALPADIDGLGDDLLSLVLVTDPFADEAHDVLASLNPAVLRSYKRHYVVDLSRPLAQIGRPSRRDTARRAARMLELTAAEGITVQSEEWVRLYQHVIDRHGLSGIAAFAPETLAAQLLLPGVEFLSARLDGELVAAEVCIRQGDVVHSHLAASSPEGYRLRAMHALDMFALKHFAGTAAWFDFGGGADASGDDGLSQYKASWATDERPTWLAGLILNGPGYEAASVAGGQAPDDYFPAYRGAHMASRGEGA